MKKSLIALLLAANTAYAQEQMKADSTTLLEDYARKTYHFLENAAQKGFDFVDRKVYEANLESQIENKIQYVIEDDKSREFFNYLGLRQYISADITSIGVDKAAANVRFEYSLDDLAFIEQYEFSLSNGNVGDIVSKGQSGIEINGKKYSPKEGTKILHLYDVVTRTWNQFKADYEAKNPGQTFVYDRKGVDVLGNHANVSIEHHAKDAYSNVVDGKVSYVVLEFDHDGKNWNYLDTSFSSVTINPKKTEKGLMDQAIDAGKSVIGEIGKMWRGDE